MSPTIFRERGYRIYFFSREERRMHVHVQCTDGEAKFWIEPKIQIARNFGLSFAQLNDLQHLLERHQDEIRRAWRAHFKT